MPTKKEEHDRMAAQLDQLQIHRLREMLKKLDPNVVLQGQAATEAGLRILILNHQFPEFYEVAQGGGFSQVQRKAGT